MKAALRWLLLLATACGGGDSPDILGLYMTTTHVGSFEACAGGDTPEYSQPYFRMEEYEGGVNLRPCPNTDPATCAGGRGVLDQETELGYRIDVYTATGVDMECVLLYEWHDASLDGDQLTYRIAHHSESGSVEPCTAEEAEARGGDMPCIAYETLIGIRVDE
jgi:hypothetical protein